MKTNDFDYSLPLELIAQTPIEPRDQSRLMVLNRSDSSMEHRKFFEITDYLRAGDVLLFNDSRVIPARLNGRKIDGGSKVVLQSGDSVEALSDTGSAVDCILSVVDSIST